MSAILLALSILLLLYALNKKKPAYLVCSVLVLILAYITWNASIYAVLSYIFVLFLIGLSKKVSLKKVAIIGVILMAIGLAAGAIIKPQYLPYLLLSSNQANIYIQELAPTTPLALIANFLLAGFLMFFGLIGFLTKERDQSQKYAYLAVLGILLVATPELLAAVRWMSLVPIPVALFAGLSIQCLRETRISPSTISRIFYITIILSIIVPIYQFGTTQVLPEVSPAYHSTMLWIASNTPQNATFLTYWADGSAIEGWGNRASYSDTVLSQDGWKIENFSKFLYQPAGNLSYLNDMKPDYLLVRGYWFSLNSTMKVEGKLPKNMSLNGTNFELLEKGYGNYTDSRDGISLIKIYNSSNTTIYKVIYG